MQRPLALLSLAALGCGASDGPLPYLYPAAPSSGARSLADLGPAVVAAVRDRAAARGSTALPPLSLTASDGTGLRLERIEIRAAVEGPLALTELHLGFRNPTDRQLEGRFQIALPPGAALSRLASRRGTGWLEAEVVERGRAQRTYDDLLHQRVDPVLLEHDAGNRFAARIFPIEAAARTELVLAYSHELAAGMPYHVPLTGLPVVDELAVSIRLGGRVVRQRRQAAAPTDLLIERPAGPAARGVRAGDAIAVPIELTAADGDDAIDDLLVLVDTSGSTAPGAARRGAALDGLVAALAAARPDLPLEVVAFDQAVAPLFVGRAGGARGRASDAMALHGALGASDLGGALAWAARGRARRVLLISDGIPTLGARDGAALAAATRGGAIARLDVLPTGVGADTRLLAELAATAGARPGTVLDATRPVEELARTLGRAVASSVAVEIDGAEWVWPARLDGSAAGRGAVVFARMKPQAPGGPVALRLRDAAGGERARAVELDAAPAPLVEREVAQAEIERILAQAATAAAADRPGLVTRATALAVERRLLTPMTALLVLESDADYQRYGLDRHALSDILAIDATGVRVVRRHDPIARRAAAPISFRDGLSLTGGAIEGRARDLVTGENLAGCTVLVTSPSMAGSQTAITDADGAFAFADLPAGSYLLTAYYAEVTLERAAVEVAVGRVTVVPVALDLRAAAGEVITISSEAGDGNGGGDAGDDEPAAADRTPQLTGRTFEATLGAAAGSAEDDAGVTFSGATSLENYYVVDGIRRVGRRDAARTPPRPRAVHGQLEDILRRVQRGELDAAICAGLAWQAKAPTDPLALVGLGEALEAGGHDRLAARAYGSLVELAPSRPELRRLAAGRLARLDRGHRALAVDVLEAALALRPDQVTGHRMLAYAFFAAGQHRRALDVLLAALARDDWDDRAVLRELVAQDAGVIAADWLRREPGRRDEVRGLLQHSQVLVPLEPSLRVTLTWENDATDLELAMVADESTAGAETIALDSTASDGFGPEVAVVRGGAAERRFQLRVRYVRRAMQGVAAGQVHIVRHDGAGHVEVETRPFVLMDEDAVADLGVIPARGRR